MKYLLDTHAILWYAQGSDSLSATAKGLMEADNCFYSPVSLWEIALKQKLGRLSAQLTIPELADFCDQTGFVELPIRPQHAEETKALDFIHRDSRIFCVNWAK